MESTATNTKKHPMHWEKGQSGNPKGRPKGPSLNNLLSERLMEVKDGRSKAQYLADVLLEMALSKDKFAIGLIWERMEGKALQQIDMTSAGESLNANVSFHGADLKEVAATPALESVDVIEANLVEEESKFPVPPPPSFSTRQKVEW